MWLPITVIFIILALFYYLRPFRGNPLTSEGFTTTTAPAQTQYVGPSAGFPIDPSGYNWGRYMASQPVVTPPAKITSTNRPWSWTLPTQIPSIEFRHKPTVIDVYSAQKSITLHPASLVTPGAG